MHTDFSVVVSVCDEPRGLEAALHSVRDQSFGGDVELIVVDGYGGDEVGDIARQYADLVLYDRAAQRSALSHQRGAARARGKHLVFLDPSAVMSVNLLARAARSLQRGYVGGSAPVRSADELVATPWPALFRTRRSHIAVSRSVPYLYCTRAAFYRTGGWDAQSDSSSLQQLHTRLHAHGKVAWDAAACISIEARLAPTEPPFTAAVVLHRTSAFRAHSGLGRVENSSFGGSRTQAAKSRCS